MSVERPRTPISPLSYLPTEIVIYIFELAAADSKPTAAALALTCKLVHQWVEPILYRTVVLHNKVQNELFERTLRSKDPEFFQHHMKHFAPAAGHSHLPSDGTHNGGGWHAIKGVKALMMSASCRPTDDQTGHVRPHEVAIRGFVKPDFFSYPAFEFVTHLFLCDVPLLYTSVLSQVLEALPYLRSLTHLACPFSNKWRGGEHNIYAEVCTLLQIPQPSSPAINGVVAANQTPYMNGTHISIPHHATPDNSTDASSQISPTPRKPLEMLLLNIFHYQFPDLERESYIWAQLAPISDLRLLLQPGEAFSVKKWEESAGGIVDGVEDVWQRARRGAEGWRSWVR